MTKFELKGFYYMVHRYSKYYYSAMKCTGTDLRFMSNSKSELLHDRSTHFAFGLKAP